MIGLIIKIIVCPITVLISSYLFDLRFTSFQAIITGLFLAFAAHLMEVLILRKGTFWISTIMDFLGAFAVIYFVQYLFINAPLNFAGAILTATLLTITEYIQHIFLLKTNKTIKNEEKE
ncbi:membrane spanning protein [Alkaliphilus metalliredigens QYMF]|uniref:Membrane spanning protein n=1 Tax=Alkaliphilus metalliredigens (strain QYMF) TaxID=293826 RepID=A6TQX9_ALKMQ|nr:DUF2512 family protein [Alkaliphilus metalliredigens]ABR48597.1 membrane spanning protein [Alkaliphilus metalliredigens QYMF]